LFAPSRIIATVERSLDDTLEMLVNYVYLARLCRPDSEERNCYLDMATKLIEEERDAPHCAQ
jgi:hypothetical protein